MRAALLTLATAALLWGCGGDDSDAPAGTTPTTTSTTAGAPPDDSDQQSETPSAAEVREATAGYRACLEERGASPGSLSAPSGESNSFDSIDEDLQKELGKLREAAAACRGKLPRDVQLGAESKADLEKLRGDAEARFTAVEAFRACMGRHGFGPEAGAREPTGDLGQAFSECRDEAAAGQ